MEDYIPTEQDIEDFNKCYEEGRTYGTPKILLVEFTNKESKEMTYNNIRMMFIMMWYRFMQDNPDATRNTVREYFENTISNFKELYTVLLDLFRRAQSFPDDNILHFLRIQEDQRYCIVPYCIGHGCCQRQAGDQ